MGARRSRRSWHLPCHPRGAPNTPYPFGAPGGHLSQNGFLTVGTSCDALEGKGDTLQSTMHEGFGIVLDALRGLRDDVKHAREASSVEDAQLRDKVLLPTKHPPRVFDVERCLPSLVTRGIIFKKLPFCFQSSLHLLPFLACTPSHYAFFCGR
jgi:hypothetical protein